METYTASDDRRARLLRSILAGDATAFGTTRDLDAAPREPDEPVRLRVAVAVALVPSMCLWALIWYALTCLITNWP